MIQAKHRRGTLAVALLALWPAAALATDGVIEINEAAVLAGGITPGDAPGYPAEIRSPGSYRLTGNLTQTAANVNVVEIRASSVTLDLNGFAIVGAGGAEGSGNGVVITGTGAQPTRQVTVRNGSIRGVAGSGIASDVLASYVVIRDVRIDQAGQSGINLGGTGAQISDVQVSGSYGHGIFAQYEAQITHSTVLNAGARGILCTRNCGIRDTDVYGSGVNFPGSACVEVATGVVEGVSAFDCKGDGFILSGSAIDFGAATPPLLLHANAGRVTGHCVTFNAAAGVGGSSFANCGAGYFSGGGAANFLSSNWCGNALCR
jgi:hypothetical protein